VATIEEIIEAIVKRAEEAKSHGIKPRLDKTDTEYYVTIPQGYKTRLYKVLIIKSGTGVTFQTYDHGKMQYELKLPDTTMDQLLEKLPLELVEIGRKEPTPPPPRPRRYDAGPPRGPRQRQDTRNPASRGSHGPAGRGRQGDRRGRS
jgi:hypothetical protein